MDRAATTFSKHCVYTYHLFS